MADEGYVKIWRKSFQNTLWKQKPFDEWHAWQYLIMKAAWKGHFVKYAGLSVELLRGQSVTTHRKLGKDWGWCHKTAGRFLEKLREGLMITTDVVPNKTPHQTPHPTRKTPHQMPHPFFVVTILNYEGYQGVPDQTPHQTPHPPRKNAPPNAPRQKKDPTEEEETRACTRTGQPLARYIPPEDMTPGAAQRVLQLSEETGIALDSEVKETLEQISRKG